MADDHSDTHDGPAAHDLTEAHHPAASHGPEHSAGPAHNPLAAEHLIGHVKDSTYFELPRFLGGKWNIPQLRASSEPIATIHIGFKPIDDRIEPLELKITKFMVIELMAAIVLVVLFVRLAGQLKRSGVAKGAGPMH